MSMPFNAQTSSRETKDYGDDSDSSDGTNPPTPKKSTLDKVGHSVGISVGLSKAHHGGQQHHQQTTAATTTSPVVSPTKSVVASPIRTLFSRPSKMNLGAAASSSFASSAAQGRDARETASPSAQYFPHSTSMRDMSSSLGNGGDGSSFSSLLKHGHSKANGGGNNAGPAASTTRGRSFDLLRVPTSLMDASTSTNSNNNNPVMNASASSSATHLPISPSFFSTGGRTVSTAEQHDDNWPLICARVLPLFNGEGLRQPIEDLNRLVATHLMRTRDRHETMHVVEDVTELFETGIRSLDNNLALLQDTKLLSRLSELWVFFFSSVLPYLEATFLPLTIELDSDPRAFVASSLGSGGGQDGSANAPANTTIHLHHHRPTVHGIATKSYRDILILPLHQRLATILSQVPLLLGQQEVFGRLLQCISVLRRVQSNDVKQQQCDALGNAVLFRRAKGRGDRRGIIGRKGGIERDDQGERERQGSVESNHTNGTLGPEIKDD